MSFSSFWIAAVAFAVSASIARSQAVGANFLYPLNGQQNVDTTQPFVWNSSPGALAYQLYVGSSPGARDLFDSRQTLNTSFPVPAFPASQTIYGRIWTNIANQWFYQDIAFTAESAPANFVFPINAQQNVDMTKPFTWTTPPGTSTYELWIGTTPGARDLLDSYQTPNNSWRVPAMPVGKMLYARIWTSTSRGWLYHDSAFTAEPAPAALLYPVSGQQDVEMTLPFRWSESPGALAYQLYVGSSPGARDLFDSRQTHGTSFSVPPLPVGQTLYARIWTNTGYHWVYQDAPFTAKAVPASFVFPVNGQQNVDTNQLFRWTTPPGTSTYQLRIGTSPGASDLMDSYQTPGSSWHVPALPAGQILYARIWTNTSGGWVYNDVSFTAKAVPTPTRIVYPADGASGVDTTRAFSWLPVANVQKYRLLIGTVAGASDLLDTGDILETSYSLSKPLPAGEWLYARIGTYINGVWSCTNSTFLISPRFIYPAVRTIGVSAENSFQWSPGAVVNSVQPHYTLSIGTTPGGSDLFVSPTISQPAYNVPAANLPAGKTLYARVSYRVQNWPWSLVADTVFTATGSSPAPAQMVYPLNGDTAVDVRNPFQWTATDMASAYELKIYSGSTVVVDSGPIRIPRYFAENLAPGQYYGELGSQIGGTWMLMPFQFAVVQSGFAMTTEVVHALWATDFVRHQADSNNMVYPWTELWNWHIGNGTGASCGLYRESLLALLSQMNVAGRLPSAQKPRKIDISFSSTNDVHTLVEFWNTDSQSWMLLDPTFALSAMRASDGQWATKEDIQQATLNQDWSAITYRQLGTFGNSVARAYYVDYPLLYLNITMPASGAGNDPTPYLTVLSSLPTNQWGVYLVKCSSSPINLTIDGESKSVSCDARGSISEMFMASTIEDPGQDGATFQICKPRWFVFGGAQ
jgi:hypothetical protein